MNYVPMPRINHDATKEERMTAFKRYAESVVFANPTRFLPLGVRKRWYHVFIIEHPMTKYGA